ncbi:MAG: hypothetical protein M1834_009339 [Cirrosporium novae-zelandiae]|nr:MAG: hypothetical protein M1834_009339 [Cirrosporium novae-zelandiae]
MYHHNLLSTVSLQLNTAPSSTTLPSKPFNSIYNPPDPQQKLWSSATTDQIFSGPKLRRSLRRPTRSPSFLSRQRKGGVYKCEVVEGCKSSPNLPSSPFRSVKCMKEPFSFLLSSASASSRPETNDFEVREDSTPATTDHPFDGVCHTLEPFELSQMNLGHRTINRSISSTHLGMYSGKLDSLDIHRPVEFDGKGRKPRRSQSSFELFYDELDIVASYEEYSRQLEQCNGTPNALSSEFMNSPNIRSSFMPSLQTQTTQRSNEDNSSKYHLEPSPNFCNEDLWLSRTANTDSWLDKGPFPGIDSIVDVTPSEEVISSWQSLEDDNEATKLRRSNSKRDGLLVVEFDPEQGYATAICPKKPKLVTISRPSSVLLLPQSSNRISDDELDHYCHSSPNPRPHTPVQRHSQTFIEKSNFSPETPSDTTSEQLRISLTSSSKHRSSLRADNIDISRLSQDISAAAVMTPPSSPLQPPPPNTLTPQKAKANVKATYSWLPPINTSPLSTLSPSYNTSPTRTPASTSPQDVELETILAGLEITIRRFPLTMLQPDSAVITQIRNQQCKDKDKMRIKSPPPTPTRSRSKRLRRYTNTSSSSPDKQQKENSTQNSRLSETQLRPLRTLFPNTSDFLRITLYATMFAQNYLASLSTTTPISSSSNIYTPTPLPPSNSTSATKNQIPNIQQHQPNQSLQPRIQNARSGLKDIGDRLLEAICGRGKGDEVLGRAVGVLVGVIEDGL